MPVVTNSQPFPSSSAASSPESSPELSVHPASEPPADLSVPVAAEPPPADRPAGPPAQERPPVRVPQRDQAGFARVNTVLVRVLGSPLARVLPLPLALLRYTGRRTGRVFTTPVGVHDVDGRVVVFTRAGWRANFRGGGPVELVRRGRVLRGTATVDEDPQHAADVMLQVLAAGRSPRQLGLEVDKGHRPTREELVATNTSVVEFDVRPA